MDAIKVMYAVYRTDTYKNPFGRDFVGYAGWHSEPSTALAEAAKRNPDIDPTFLQVNPV